MWPAAGFTMPLADLRCRWHDTYKEMGKGAHSQGGWGMREVRLADKVDNSHIDAVVDSAFP